MRIVMVRSNPMEPDSRVEKEANALIKAGHKVVLLGWDRSANYWSKASRKKLQNGTVRRICFGAKAEYGSGMKSLLPFIKFQIRLALWLCRNRKKFDVCHLCDFDTAFTGSKVCRFFHKKYIFDIFDYLSTNPQSFFGKVIEKAENAIINKADAVIICSEQRQQQLHKTRPKKLTIIHNTPDVPKTLGSMELNKEKVKIVYVGIFEVHRLIKELIEIVKRMPDVELHIGGFGHLEEYVKEQTKECDNIIYYGKIPYTKTLELEKACDIITAIYNPAIGNAWYAAPNKFYEGLYFGKPIIMVKGTGMSDVVEDNDIGVLIDYNEQSLEDGIRKIIERKNDWNGMSTRMKKLYEEKYSWSEMEKRLIGLYKEM